VTTPTRRSFLKRTATASACVAAWAWTGGINARGANERMAVGVIGCGGRGSSLAAAFAEIANVAYACDPDESRRRQTQEKVRARQIVVDVRRVLDDKTVDAVVVATPDHWHAPAAIMACEAGKHVYVEKPQSHNLRESRLLLDAARRNKVVVQHGTQSRSSPLIAGAIHMLREGVIGEVLVAKAWNIQRRGKIGRERPSDPPPGLDYDMWVGPAEFLPFQKNRFHYLWHWWHNFGTGDIGNDGAHEIDYARWGLGVSGLPATAAALGGKYSFDDDQQFPDTATCAFEWPGDGRVGSRRQLIFEMRLWSTNYPFNCDSGAEFYGTAGRMLVSKRGKVLVYGERDRPIDSPRPKTPPQLAASHQADFLDAIRERRKPSADVAEGHDSVALIHLANVAVRLGRSLQIEPGKEAITGDADANALLSRTYRAGGHWAIPKGAQT
jgi:predicted dehydrogenase